MNTEQSTEESPLLVRLPISSTLPSLSDGLRAVQSGGVGNFSFPEYTLPTVAAQTAYQLLIIFQWRLTLRRKALDTDDIWEHCDQQSRITADVNVLDDRTVSIWDNFIKDHRTHKEIEDVLWLQFPVETNGDHFLRVVDCAAYFPNSFLTDALINLSLWKTWRYGLVGDIPSNTSLTRRLLRRFDALATPRVLHLFELVGELMLLVTLAHFLLYPPTRSIITGSLKQQEQREYFLTLFPIALLVRPWSIRVFPFLLVLSSFMFSLPLIPFPDETSFMILHLALALQIMFLHFPRPPSPLFLLPAHWSLPLSVLLTYNMSRMFFPVVLFFLPVTLFAVLLLSASLADTTLKFFPLMTVDPSPMQTRTVFLILLAVILLLLLLSLIVGAAKFPSILIATDNSRPPHGQIWDRYSRRVGLDARKALIHVLVRYSKPYYFPPPLNLLHLIFIRLPRLVLYLFGKKGPSLPLEVAERMLWRITVGPVIWVVAGVWFWCLWK